MGRGQSDVQAQRQSFAGRHASDIGHVTGQEGAADIGGLQPRVTASDSSRHSTADLDSLQSVWRTHEQRQFT